MSSNPSETKTHPPRTGWVFLPICLFVLFLDQSTKLMISALFSLGEGVEITSFFSLFLTHNYGAAFSFLADAGGWQKYFFITMSSVISCFIFIWLIRSNTKEQRLLCLSLSLLLGGALGNLIDRALYGYVVDFLDVHWQQYHWPVFNIADIAISIGIFCLLIDSFKSHKNEKK